MTKLRIKDVLQFPTVKNERIGRVMEKICRFVRELPVERHEELIRRAMRWLDPLADQIARVLKR
jgi:hypothetical protein